METFLLNGEQWKNWRLTKEEKQGVSGLKGKKEKKKKKDLGRRSRMEEVGLKPSKLLLNKNIT